MTWLHFSVNVLPPWPKNPSLLSYQITTNPKGLAFWLTPPTRRCDLSVVTNTPLPRKGMSENL